MFMTILCSNSIVFDSTFPVLNFVSISKRYPYVFSVAQVFESLFHLFNPDKQLPSCTFVVLGSVCFYFLFVYLQSWWVLFIITFSWLFSLVGRKKYTKLFRKEGSPKSSSFQLAVGVFLCRPLEENFCARLIVATVVFFLVTLFTGFFAHYLRIVKNCRHNPQTKDGVKIGGLDLSK